jgi:hypothetical protein
MFIKLNFNTAQPPSVWFDAIYWIMLNQSSWPSINTGAVNAGLFVNSVNTGSASTALKTAISNIDTTNSEIWNSTFSGSMPVVYYNSTTGSQSLTIKHAVQDDISNTTFSWMQINATTFQHATSAGSALTANTTGTSAITLNNASATQTWNGAVSSFCYWAYISPTTFVWAATRAYNNTTSTSQYTKSGWHMNYGLSDWSYANSRQSGPFMSTQYTRLDVWNTVSNGIIPVCWTNGYDTTRPFLGMSYSYDFAYAPGVVGNLVNSYNYNPRYASSNSNTTFSIMNTIDATPNNTGTWNIYGASATSSLTQSTATAGQKVSFGTNIKPFQDQSSLVNSTAGPSGTSGYIFQNGVPAATGTFTVSAGTSGGYTMTYNTGTVPTAGQLIAGSGIATSLLGGLNNPVYVTLYSGGTVYLSQALTSAATGSYSLYTLSSSYQIANYSKTTLTENTVTRSAWNGLQGASLWDKDQQNGNFYRWPTATATATGAFTMQPLVWNRADFNNIGGLISDKAGVYIFNGDYTAGDEFTVGGTVYSIWPMADGWSERIGLAVPKR